MKRIVLIALTLVLAGCAASAAQTYRPAANPSTEWRIEGTQSTFGKMLITINGQNVIEGSMSIWSGEGQFSGSYYGQPVAAVCDKGAGSSIRTRCILSVNSEKIATLYFRAL